MREAPDPVSADRWLRHGLALAACAAAACSMPFDVSVGSQARPDASQDAGTADGADASTPDASTPDGSLPGPDAGVDFAARCADEPLPSSAVLFACDCGPGAAARCVPGDDAQPGTSAAAPRRTFLRMSSQFAAIPAGTTIAFCRGGSFDANQGEFVPNATACGTSSPCTIRDYAPPWGDGSEARPLLAATGAGHVFRFDSSGGGGFRVLNLALQRSGAGAPNDDGAILVFESVRGVELCNLDVAGFDIGVNIAPSAAGAVSGIALRGSRVADSVRYGLIGGCDDCSVEQTLFENNGAQTLFITDGARMALRDLAVTVGLCDQTILYVAGGQHPDLVLERNEIRAQAVAPSLFCNGIRFEPTATGASTSRGAVVRGNRVLNTVSGIGLAFCPGCLVEDNLVVLNPAGDHAGISVPWMLADLARGDAETSGVSVVNNTVLAPGGSGVGLEVGSEGQGYVVANNALAYSGSAAWSCFAYGQAPSSYLYVDHNLCFSPLANPSAWVAGKGGLTAWRTASGFDASSLVGDPLFVDPSSPAWDFTPQVSSPLVGAGSTAHFAPADITGKPRDTAPDIGAFER